ncbi:unnamed protein product [Gadus morhua 'NCC']
MLRLQQAGPEPRALCLRATHPPSTCSFLLFLDMLQQRPPKTSHLEQQSVVVVNPEAGAPTCWLKPPRQQTPQPLSLHSWPSLALPRLQAVKQSFRCSAEGLTWDCL